MRPQPVATGLQEIGLRKMGVSDRSPSASSAEPELTNAVVRPDERLVMIVGGFGSGKTEVAVNLAINLARRGRTVQVADLDLVNPYFRCREARALMEHHAIRVVVPPGAQAYADLPILLPEIKGMLHPPEDTLSLFDVGGDDVGATVLSTFRPELEEGSYELWQVINSKRPFSHTVEGCLATRAALEKASRLRVTGLLANSHLIQETTPEAVLEGWELTHELATITDLPIRCVAVMAELADAPQLGIIDAPLIRLERYMLPPWLVRSAGNDPAGSRRERLPAGRPRPIGQPPTIRTPLSPGEDHVDRD